MSTVRPTRSVRGRRARLAAWLLAVLVVSAVVAPATAGAVPLPAPALTGLASSTHPTDTVWYPSRTAAFQWDGDAAFTGYSFALDRDAVAPALDTVGDVLRPRYALGTGWTLEPSMQWMPEHALTADFDNNGTADTVWVCNYRAYVQLGNGVGGFTAMPFPLEPEYLAFINDIAAGDFNKDGRLDLAFSIHSSTKQVAVMVGNGDGTFRAPQSYPSTGWSTGRSLTASDFDGDGTLDVAVAYDQMDAGISVFKGVGDGTFSAPTTYAVPGSFPANWIWKLASGDLNGDSRPEIVGVAHAGDRAVIWSNDGAGSFASAPTTVAVGQYPYDVAIADMNADGRPDIVTGNGGGTIEPATLLVNDGGGAWTRRAVASAYNAQFYGIELADMNVDGALDIVGFNRWSTTGGSSIDVLLNDGAGSFPNAVVTQGYSNGRRAFAVADYDRSGLKDVVVCDAQDNAVHVMFAAPGASVTAPSDGVWYFHVRGVGGGPAAPVSDMRIMIDSTGPDVALSGAESGSACLPDAVPTVSIVASDPNMPDASGLAEIHWTSSTGGSGVVASASAPVSIPTTPGVYWWMAHAVDNAGNQGIERTLFITVLGDVAGLASPTHPDPGHWYPATTAEFVWEEGSGQYSFSLDHDPKGSPDLIPDDYGYPMAPDAEGSLCSTTVTGLTPGTWYFHVREVGEGAGARVSTMRVNVRGTGTALLGSILFTGDSSRLTSRSKARLRDFAAFIESRSYTTVYLDGYTARRSGGSAAYRKRLSTARAVAVQKYLASCLRQLQHPVTFVVKGRGAVPGSPRLRAADRKVVVRAK